MLQQGCLELRHQLVWRPARWQGLLDTLAIVADTIRPLSPGGDTRDATHTLQECLAAIAVQAEYALKQPDSAPAILANLLRSQMDDMNRRLMAVVTEEPSSIAADTLHTLRLYVSRVHQHVEGMRQEREETMPWLTVMAAPPALFSASDCPEPLRRAWVTLVEALPINPRLDELGDACLLYTSRCV